MLGVSKGHQTISKNSARLNCFVAQRRIFAPSAIFDSPRFALLVQIFSLDRQGEQLARGLLAIRQARPKASKRSGCRHEGITALYICSSPQDYTNEV